MSKTVRLTMAQALTRFLSRQMTVIDGKTVPIFGGRLGDLSVTANVAGVGEALYQVRGRTADLPRPQRTGDGRMPAIAYAKANFRRRFMAATTSIGPGALNMVTAARARPMSTGCPCCCCPAMSSPTAWPDPVFARQAEDFSDGTADGQ